MFSIEPHEEGFLVRWDAGDAAQANVLGAELFFGGLRRTRETAQSFVVPRYRNELETLGVLYELCREQNIEPIVDATLRKKQQAGEAEQSLLVSLRQHQAPTDPVPAVLPESASRPELSRYPQAALSKTL